MLFTVIPVWLTETVPPEGRGILVDAHPILINFGYCLASYVGVGFYYVQGNNQQWRGPLAIGCVPSILAVLTVPFLPESPRWLLMHGREAEAWSIVQSLHWDPSDTEHEYATREFADMKRQIEVDRAMEFSYMDVIKKPSYRKRFLVGGALVFFLQGSGALVINSKYTQNVIHDLANWRLDYGVYLYAALGFNAEKQLHLQAGWVAVAAVVNWGAVLVVDRMPRPWLITIGFAGCLGCLIAEATIQATSLNSDNQNALQAGVAMLYVFVFFYGFFLDGSTFCEYSSTYILSLLC